MSEKANYRRNFLKGLLAIGVISTTCPRKLLAKIEPEKLVSDPKGILGIYKLKLSDYPKLATMWGVVRIEIPTIEGAKTRVVITRIPKDSYGVDFSVILENCTHQGRPIYDVNPETEIIECSGHGSTFDPTGTYIAGPANKDLETYKITYDGGEYLEFECYFFDPKTDVSEQNSKYFLNDIYPNPCDDFAVIGYGISESNHLDVDLIDLNGFIIRSIHSGFIESGSYNLRFNTSQLNTGTYFVKMKYLNNEKIVKLLVAH
jgi:nitrite reductase/ring-hydroxylating ferredoxin subunit